MPKKDKNTTPTVPMTAYEFDKVQLEVQRVVDIALSRVSTDLNGAVIAGKTVRVPTGQVVATVDTYNGNREARSKVLGHYRHDSYEVDGVKLGQIAFAPYHLNRSTEDIYSTAVHEVIHLVLAYNDIRDTSRQGRWHNKRFLAAVDKVRDLDGFENDSNGVATDISDTGKIYAREEVLADFGNIFKILEPPRPRKEREYKVLDLECSECQERATVSIASYNGGFATVCAYHPKAGTMRPIDAHLERVGELNTQVAA